QSAKDQTEIDDAIAALDDVRTDFSYWIDQFGYIKAYDLFVFGSYNTMKPGGGWYAAGTTITIDAGTRSGYSFSGWTASGVTLANPNAATTTLIMPADDVEVYAHWTPTGGGGFSGGGSSGGSSGRRPAGNAPVNVTPQAANTATQSAIAAAQAASSDDAVANIKNPGEISLATLKDMAKQAKQAGVALELQADNVNGGAVDVRLTITPARATKDLNLSASTVSSDAVRTKEIFSKSFSNNFMVVSFGQQGKFGQSVAVAAKLVSGLNTGKLAFYAYDKAANTYKRIKAPKYKIDGSGFVHFTTKLAGSIIISDRPLVKR
ncbi:MAG: hypothetical protein LBS18_08540, partial [Clostridiales bacterium]|nr:hypothetical protein [Clostridiales bacterium]